MQGEELDIIKYDILKGTKHCFTTRKGGVSAGVLASLNMSFSREASAENVLENYRRVSQSLGVDFSKMTRVPQLHTNHVINITAELAGMGVTKPVPREIAEYGYDALVTNVRGVSLCTMHADCVPVLLYDREAGAVGAVHSGWRGTVLKISENAVRMMQKELGADPLRIKAVIGPSICASHFETDSDVFWAVREAFGSIAEDEKIVYKTENKYHISVSGLVYHTLTEAGLRPENIYTDPRCTYSEEKSFFSHRRDKGGTGAMAAVISLE